MSPRFIQLFIITHGAQDERVEAALVDEDRIGLVVRTSVANRDGGFVFAIYMLSHRIATIATCRVNRRMRRMQR